MQPLLHVLFGLGHINHIKINQKTNENIQEQYKLSMKTYASNMCYSWLTFLLTFLAGRLTFFLTFSYMHSFCLLSAAAAGSFVAWLLVPIGFQYGFLICW